VISFDDRDRMPVTSEEQRRCHAGHAGSDYDNAQAAHYSILLPGLHRRLATRKNESRNYPDNSGEI
jgi:hypothetical protein